MAKNNENRQNRNVNIIKDLNGDKIVVINDIIFKGRRKICWNDVEAYLQQYVGEFYSIADTKEIVYIGTDLPDEYANSNYTHRLKGTSAKAKANAAQAIPEMIEIAVGKYYEENRKEKHAKDAKYGWYKYESKFALPVYGREGNIERYNIFNALMVMRCSKEHKMYLYDIIEIKKK
ncbi:hypothetical protein [Blautia sp. MSJ-19]|uniref:hypothetical protein n=1 Tax=Blautia sp. MSJ-19 TaxID=2841517 RepID=UPI001C0EF7DA|nr:hypothetical protein [Blautia sp. MSJ-19]MBU5480991.1 hypothetical protein [Blautia sp. MSJ-19]